MLHPVFFLGYLQQRNIPIVWKTHYRWSALVYVCKCRLTHLSVSNIRNVRSVQYNLNGIVYIHCVYTFNSTGNVYQIRQRVSHVNVVTLCVKTFVHAVPDRYSCAVKFMYPSEFVCLFTISFTVIIKERYCVNYNTSKQCNADTGLY